MQPRDLEIKVGWLHKLGRINVMETKILCHHTWTATYTFKHGGAKGVMDLGTLNNQYRCERVSSTV